MKQYHHVTDTPLSPLHLALESRWLPHTGAPPDTYHLLLTLSSFTCEIEVLCIMSYCCRRYTDGGEVLRYVVLASVSVCLWALISKSMNRVKTYENLIESNQRETKVPNQWRASGDRCGYRRSVVFAFRCSSAMSSCPPSKVVPTCCKPAQQRWDLFGDGSGVRWPYG
jgi:hypothetical protein